MIGACARCRARVLWVVLPSGKAMPVDPEPDDAGTVAVQRTAAGAVLGRVVTKAVPARPFEHLHVTHFATCPEEHHAHDRRRDTRRPPRPREGTGHQGGPGPRRSQGAQGQHARAGAGRAVRCADIGEPVREVEFEPMPDTVPQTEPAAPAPEREPVPA